MEKTFSRYKWKNLISFSLMYSFVYLGRFNVNNLIEYINDDIVITAVQEDAITMSVFLSYAVGSFVNGYLADRYGARRMIILGGTMTVVLNMITPLNEHWAGLFIIWLVNGYFQSMIWVGGISMMSHWWREGERGKGVGIANFFSGMSHTIAYIVPIMVMSVWPSMGWHGTFLIPMLILLTFIVIFAIFSVEKPEDVELEDYELKSKRHVIREEELKKIEEKKEFPWKYFFSQPKFCWWCFIALLSSICRYGLLNWVPLYYKMEMGGSILSESFSNLTLPVGMAFGTLIITWTAGTKLFDNKGLVVIAMAALCGTLIIIFPMINSEQSVLVGIFFTGFALYGINGILWVHAIDQGGRVFTGSVAGVLNGFAYMGAFIEGFFFRSILNLFENYLAIFVVMEVLCILMVICGMMTSKKNTSIIPEIRE